MSSSLRPRRCCLSATAAVRTFATHMRESDDGLSRWLKDAFEINHVDPEHLFLIGSRGDVELISGRLSEALEMSVVTSNEAQLILARGTALMVRANAEAVAVPLSGEQPATLKQNAAALALMAVAAVLVMGLPMFISQPESPSTPDQWASNSSETSVSIEAVPASPVPPPSKQVIEPMVQPAPASLPPSAPSPPVAEVSAPEAPVEPLAVPETPIAAVPPEAPAADMPEGPTDEAPAVDVPEGPPAEVPPEGAPLPAPAEVPDLPAQTADVPAEIPHLPAEGAPHLPGRLRYSQQRRRQPRPLPRRQRLRRKRRARCWARCLNQPLAVTSSRRLDRSAGSSCKRPWRARPRPCC